MSLALSVTMSGHIKCPLSEPYFLLAVVVLFHPLNNTCFEFAPLSNPWVLITAYILLLLKTWCSMYLCFNNFSLFLQEEMRTMLLALICFVICKNYSVLWPNKRFGWTWVIGFLLIYFTFMWISAFCCVE